MSRFSLLAAVGAALLLGACDKLPLGQMAAPAGDAGAGGANGVAIMDLGAVAKALGRDEVFKQQIEEAGRQLGQQVNEFSSGLQDQLRSEQAKLGEEPTEAQRRQLQQMAVQAQRQVQQSQLLARQKARQFQLDLANRFRGEVQPVAAEIAREKGARVILLSNAILWFEPSVDITGAVIDAMRARGAASGAPSIAPSAEEAGKSN